MPVKHRLERLQNYANGVPMPWSLKRWRLCQSQVAKVLDVPNNRVVVRIKRMGGGFGGKESRSTILTTVVAVAAAKYA